MRETTINHTRGELDTERKIAYVNALKALDYQKHYEEAMKDIGRVFFDMSEEDFENNYINFLN